MGEGGKQEGMLAATNSFLAFGELLPSSGLGQMGLLPHTSRRADLRLSQKLTSQSSRGSL